MYCIYISRAAEFFGITRTREIFEQAISALPEKNIKDMCLKYADIERKLGEVDRARAIYVHASQFCDPRSVEVRFTRGEFKPLLLLSHRCAAGLLERLVAV
jgi:pre-mRNA-splicing factor SYF1